MLRSISFAFANFSGNSGAGSARRFFCCEVSAGAFELRAFLETFFLVILIHKVNQILLIKKARYSTFCVGSNTVRFMVLLERVIEEI